MTNLEQIFNDISLIESSLSEKGNQVRKWIAINESVQERADKVISQIETIKKEMSFWETAKTLHGLIMAEARSTHKKDIVFCVDSIVKHFYGNEYDFDVEFSDDGSLDFIVKENVEGKTKTYYINGDDSAGLGGGLSDTVSTALRIMVLIKSGSIGPLVLDEAYRQLDNERACKVGGFLRGICEEHGHQIIMFTHLQQVADEADMKIHVQKINGKSVVTCEDN